MKQVFFFALIALSLKLVGCSDHTPEKSSRVTQPPRQVKTLTVSLASQSGQPGQRSFPGVVIPQNRAIIQSKIQAWVTRIAVPLGAKVRRGDILIELDSRDLDARVSQAQAVHSKVSADLKRFEELLAKKMVSQQEFDARLEQAALAIATLEEAQAARSYVKIEAPFSGVVTQRLIDVGDFAQVGSQLLTLEESGPLLFSVQLPESRLGHFRKGDSVQIEIPSLQSTIHGIIAMVPESVDPNTHSFEIRITLQPASNIMPGMFGRLQDIPDGDATSIWIPRSAIVKRGQLDLVFVSEENLRASLRLVRIGRETAELAEILAGLNSGELLILEGQPLLSDGDSIEVIQ